MIWIRADANEDLGAGHIMRCLSVAEALSYAGADVLFLVADEDGAALVRKKGFPCQVLHTPWQDMEKEIPVLEKSAGSQSPDFCLVDSYQATAPYLEALGKWTKTALFDDLGDRAYPVRVLINYNLYAKDIPYEKCGIRPDTRLLLGPAYAPLRQEFCGLPERNVADVPGRVLLTTGGGDRLGLSPAILTEALTQSALQNLSYEVVCGAYSPYAAQLAALAKTHSNVHIHENAENMAALMMNCDLAISAAGSTMYELCAAGLPTICFSFVENQNLIAEAFSQGRYACGGFCYDIEGNALPAKIADCLSNLVANPSVCAQYGQRARTLVDGHGAERIAETLLH